MYSKFKNKIVTIKHNRLNFYANIPLNNSHFDILAYQGNEIYAMG